MLAPLSLSLADRWTGLDARGSVACGQWVKGFVGFVPLVMRDDCEWLGPFFLDLPDFAGGRVPVALHRLSVVV